MSEIQKEYWKLVAAYEEKELAFSEKIKFKAWLLDILKNHHAALTNEELRNANNILSRLQSEIDNY